MSTESKMNSKSMKWSILIYFMNQIFNESEVTLKGVRYDLKYGFS